MANVELGKAYLSIIPSLRGVNEQLASEVKPASFSPLGRAVGMGLVAGIGAAVVGIGAIVKTGVGEVMDASAGTAQLEAGIRSTGNAAKVSVEGMNALAGSIQGYSGQTDDSITKAQGLLLTFTNIKNEGPDKIFDQATIAAADMAAKFGGDASSQAVLLGKALNDPVKGVSALQRVGVSFTAAQKDQIKAMVESGDTMGAQKLILKELNTEFGGAAKAAGDSLPGQLERGKRAFEDMAQSVMTTFVPLVTPALQGIPPLIQAITPAVQGAASALFTGFGMVGTAVSSVVGFFQQYQGVGIAVAAVIGFIVAASAAHALVTGIQSGALMGYVMQLGVVRALTGAWAATQWLLNAAMSANPIGIVIVVIAALIAAVVWAYNNVGWFRDGVNNAWRTISGVTMGVLGAVGGFFRGLWSGATAFGRAVIAGFVSFISGAWNNARSFTTSALGAAGGFLRSIWAGATGFARGVIAGFVGFILGSWQNISGTTRGVFSGIQSFIGGIWGGIRSGAQGAINGVVGFFQGLPGRIVGAVGNLGGLLLNVGGQVIDGLRRGIEGALGGLLSTLGDVGRFIADNKGPEDYDRRLLTPHGGWIIGGLAASIEDSLDPLLQPALTAVGEKIAGQTYRATAPARATEPGSSGWRQAGDGSRQPRAKITVMNPDPETAAELTARKLVRAGQG